MAIEINVLRLYVHSLIGRSEVSKLCTSYEHDACPAHRLTWPRRPWPAARRWGWGGPAGKGHGNGDPAHNFYFFML